MGDMGKRAQLGAEPSQRFDRDGGCESGRQLLARSRLDGGKNIGWPATVETARHYVSVHGDTGARERLRQHGAGYRFAVYKYTVTIEDDQGPLR